jgi:cell division protein FtsN
LPEWTHGDRPRTGRVTLIIALFATAIGIVAGGSTVSFLMEQNIPATTSVQSRGSLKIGQPEEQQQSISPAIDKAGSGSASQSEPSADSQPSSTAQPSAITGDATPPEAAIRAEPEKPAAVDAAVAYCMQRYRSYDPASRTFLGNDGRRHPCPREAN